LKKANDTIKKLTDDKMNNSTKSYNQNANVVIDLENKISELNRRINQITTEKDLLQKSNQSKSDQLGNLEKEIKKYKA